MTVKYEEIENIIPKNAFYALIFILIASDAFMLVCALADIGTEMWMFAITTVIFAIIIVAAFFVKMKVSVDDEKIVVILVKKYVIPFSDIIDHKVGDIDIIRNYSGWGIKNVKFKNLICAGYEKGITLKLIGRKVMTVSLSDPEAFVSFIPEKKEE